MSEEKEKVFKNLEKVGFFTWIELAGYVWIETLSEILDETEINSIRRTGWNWLAFRYFREVYNLNPEIHSHWQDESKEFSYVYCFSKKHEKRKDEFEKWEKGHFTSQEEAEYACLVRLISFITDK